MILNLLLFISFAITAFYLYMKYAFTYWSKKNVPYIPPKFPLGNINSLWPNSIAFGSSTLEFYEYFRKHGYKIGGTFLINQPQLVIVDPEYVKDILLKDFQYFADRGVYYNGVHDPISANMFVQEGEDWKKMRTKTTPSFSTAKLKGMVPLINDVAEILIQRIERESKNGGEVDILEVFNCFFIDVIGSVIFGIETKSLTEPNEKLRIMGEKAMNPSSLKLKIERFVTMYMPDLSRKLGIKAWEEDVGSFFYNCVSETVAMRERSQTSRPDILDTLIKMKNSEDQNEKITLMQVAAQSFLYFMAGYETSAKTSTFAVYEMSRNPEIQRRARGEVQEVLKKYNNEITYDSIAEMKYLDQIANETLRLYPILATLQRKCVKNYKLRNTDTVIDKGTPVVVSAMGLHHDPGYFPEPKKWDPERFNPENKAKIVSCSYLPFGEGPRNCIGLRLGQLQTKLALVHTLRNFEFTVSERTAKLPELPFDKNSFLSSPTEKPYVKFNKISI